MDRWIFKIFLLPAIMYFAGLIWFKCPPENSNSIFGLRTQQGKKNREAWEFSQKYFGKAMMITGIVFIVITWIVVLYVDYVYTGINKIDAAVVAYTLFAVELLGLCFVSIMTKKIVKKIFS